MPIVIGIILVPFMYAILQKALPNTPIMKKVHSYVHLLMITAVMLIGISSFSNRPESINELIKNQAIELQSIQTDSTNFVSQNVDILVRSKLAEICPEVVVLKTEVNLIAVRDNIIIYTVGEVEEDIQQEIIKELVESLQISKDAVKFQ